MKHLFLICALCFLSCVAEAAGTPQQLTSSNYNGIVASPYVVIDVYTDWCGPCKSLAPIFQSLNDEFGNQYRFVKLNGDQERGLISSLGITGYPTLIFFKNGQEVGRHVGSATREQIVSMFSRYFR